MGELPRQISRFQILSEAGRGKRCVVYRAFDPLLRRACAVKIPLPDPVEPWSIRSQRFLREAHAIACIEPTPNIPKVYEMGEDHGQLYIVLECFEGVTFQSAVSAGSIKASQGIQIIATIAGAVALIHKQGMVHRALSAQNVLISSDGTAMLTGFSRACALSPDIRQETDVEALQTILEWVFATAKEPWPSHLECVRPPKPVGSAEELQSILIPPRKSWRQRAWDWILQVLGNAAF